MTERERSLLLHGPYKAPPLKVGDRVSCLYRDCDVIILSWTDAPIPWPRCKRVGAWGGAGRGLLVNEELGRAVRNESAAAIRFHSGASASVVHDWRQLFGVGRLDTDGSRRLHKIVSARGAETVRTEGLDLSEAERQRRAGQGREVLKRLRAEGRWSAGNPAYRPWSAEELALLDAGLTDEELAGRTGRTRDAVRSMRNKRRRAGS